MAQSAKNSEATTLTCVQIAFRSRIGIMAALAGVFLAWGVLAAGGEWFTFNQPPDATINGVEIATASTASATRSIEVRITVSPNPDCVRASYEALTRIVNGERLYYPIASALNGVGFPQSTQTLKLVAALPPGLPPGDYVLEHRSISTCHWFGGFLPYTVDYGAPPVPVTIWPQ